MQSDHRTVSTSATNDSNVNTRSPSDDKENYLRGILAVGGTTLLGGLAGCNTSVSTSPAPASATESGEETTVPFELEKRPL
ncbi:MAG: hypothetical protein J07HN6_02486 [Halonotius sp. J07HN6]|nr:MAG: hypothetical protein J07HN6_02486 [Halonotius sp. J07HN6]